jgi:hypothetical protein
MKLLSCRLLGIGRNQYIDLMNQTRSKTKFGGFSTSLFRKSYRDLLPSRPVSDLVILPWWVVQVWQHVKMRMYHVPMFVALKEKTFSTQMLID